MLPSIFGENLFDDFFTDPFGMMVMPQRHDPLYGKHSKNLMKTDVRETEDSYELDVDLPGFKKDEVNVELKNGYLTIQAAKGLDKDETDKKGKYIRQERYAGSSLSTHHNSKRRSLLLLRLRARFTRNTRSLTIILTVSPHIGNHVSEFSPHLTNRVYKFRHNPFI